MDEPEVGNESLEDTIRRVWDEFEKYGKSLDDESDRGVAILAMCRIEAILDKGFGYLVPDTEFPLRSMEVKLYVGLVAGLYDKKVFDGLVTANKIRKRFAHLPEAKDFSFQDVRSLCGKLKNCITDYMDLEDFSKAKTDRERYLMYIKEASKCISNSVFEKTGHRIWWHSEGVS